MKYSVFTLEEWFDRYEFKVDHLLGSSSCAGMTVDELFDLTGEAIDFGKTKLTSAPVGGLPELQEPSLRGTRAPRPEKCSSPVPVQRRSFFWWNPSWERETLS